MTKKKKSTTQTFEYMFGDVIKKVVLFAVAVKLHQCQDWYDAVTDPKATNKGFELPVAAVAKLIKNPCKQHDAPVSYSPQNEKELVVYQL